MAVGDSTRLEIIFSTKLYNRRITKRPRIETNEAAPTHYVTITATVTPASVVTSPLVVSGWPVVASGPLADVSTEHTFDITNTSSGSLDLTIIDFAASYFDVDIPSHIEPGQTATCGVSIHADVIHNEFRKSLTIEVSDSAHTRFTIPVRRTVP